MVADCPVEVRKGKGGVTTEHFMKKAIDLAYKGAGFVNPDPLSGAVIVKDNKIISEGYYKSIGSETAERQALQNVTEDVQGAELYLNIEPFRAEQNITALLEEMKEKGIQKVYIGMRDPNPDRVTDFILEMERINMEYEVGVLWEECEELNEIYAHYIVNKTPFVVVKWAMTLDGKLASKTGDSKWISSEDSLKFVHQLRQRVSAILVGENTVRIDNPMLTTRLEGVEISHPLRVVISKYGEIPMESNVLLVDEKIKTLMIVSEGISVEKERQLLETGVQIVKMKETNGRIDFKDITKALGEKGIDSLYIEGGSAILASAFESRIIHKVYAAVAPKIIGGNHAITPVGGTGIEKMNDAILLKKVSHEIVGQDVIIKGYI